MSAFVIGFENPQLSDIGGNPTDFCMFPALLTFLFLGIFDSQISNNILKH